MSTHILTKWLNAIGIKDPNKELSTEEKATLETWKRILTEGEVSVDKVKQFCDYQLSVIEMRFRETALSDREKANLTLVHSVYSSLRAAIIAPKAERETLEKYLNTLINSRGQGS